MTAIRRLLPTPEGPAAGTPYAWDGSDWQALRSDITGLTTPALRVSLPVDRNAQRKDMYIDLTLGNHGFTIRQTYTIPAGVAGLLSHAMVFLDIPSTAGDVVGTVRINSHVMLTHYLNSGAQPWNRVATASPSYYLLPNDVVDIDTINSTASNCHYIIMVGILIFNL
jgi:hypothetical protein